MNASLRRLGLLGLAGAVVAFAARRRSNSSAAGRSPEAPRREVSPRLVAESEGRPEDDERPLKPENHQPQPQPERAEPPLTDPGLTDLSRRDWVAIFVRAGKETLSDNMPLIASALAYSSFFAIPSVMLLAVGLVTLVSDAGTIETLMDKFGTIAPPEAVDLLGGSLQQLERQPSAGVTMTAVGLVLAVWSTGGAMTAYMTGFNLAYDQTDGRSFVRKRLIASAMAACIGAAVLLVGTLLILGPLLQRWVGSALGLESVVAWAWWLGQWPILVGGLLAAFATLLHLGPDVEHPRWQLITPGAVVAVVAWIVISGAFAAYTTLFGSYNKTWGSLSAVIVMLTWLWLTGLALLFGAELNSEVERSRELRRGDDDADQRSYEPASE